MPASAPPRRSRLLPLLAGLFAIVLGTGVGLRLTIQSTVSGSTGSPDSRQALFALLRPAAIRNCQLTRFGEPHDGGYLMCGNLLGDIQAAYSYGISGYDQWGCDISTARGVTLHEYDCFDTTQPACPTGRARFHAECVGAAARTEEGRPFDTIQGQLEKNGDASKRIVMKIDVEGAEWDSFLAAPDAVFEQIDQLAVEFHGFRDRKSVPVLERLRRFFEVAHVHFNNAACMGGLEPFPSWAYEVLFVNKRIAVVDPGGRPADATGLDARNIPFFFDCQG